MKNFKTIMIRVKENSLSDQYAKHCSKSWNDFDLRYFDAITPDTLSQQSGLTFGKRTNGAEVSDTEKACFYSQYHLWKKCALERMPILILEHDAWLQRPEIITYNPSLFVQFFGQHAMEAVMFHPQFCDIILDHVSKNPVSGPMNLVDGLLGYFNNVNQSRYGLPHSRYLGKYAPVHSVIDPVLGTTVTHPTGTTVDRLKKDADLFRLVDLKNSNQ